MNACVVQLGRYRVEHIIGRGGFGEVYRAYDPLLQRHVAVKVLRLQDSQNDSLSLGASIQEARAASALNHPGIVTIYDVGEEPQSPYIVMEWIGGNTLREELTGEPLPLPRVASVGSQIAAALARAHEVGLVHRDLKPENVMVRSDGVAKILDFGLAKRRWVDQVSPRAVAAPVGDAAATVDVVATSMPITVQSTVSMGGDGPWRMAGTLGYMAPEQIVGPAVSAPADIFALGVMLYEMTTGKQPFRGERPEVTLYHTLHTDPTPPGTLAELPAGWSEIILRLLQKDPQQRPTSAAEVLHVLGGGPVAATANVRIKSRAESRAVPIVGRSADLEFLGGCWATVSDGYGTFVLLSGEPGIGKTTLAENFLSILRLGADTLVATGHCSERLGPGEAYAPFLEATSQLVTSSQGGLIRSIIRTKAPTWFAQLFPQDVSEEVKRDLIGANQERMQRELVDVFEEIGRSFSLCILIEDVQWADERTSELIGYLARRLGSIPILAIVSFRPSELHAGNLELENILREMEGRQLAERLDLNLLRPDDIAEHVARSFSGHRFPPAFIDWLYRKTEGNPLFLTGLLRYLVERTAIVDGDGWNLVRPLSALEDELPSTGRALVDRIMARLTAEERKILDAASVSGEVFDSLILSDVTGVGHIDLEQVLDRLDRVHGLVAAQEEWRWPDGETSVRYRFVHVLYQNVLYDELTPIRRRRQHGQVGRALVDHLGESTSRAAGELGMHFDRAGAPRDAIRYYLQAATTEMSKFALPQAEAFCDRALELVDKLSGAERETTTLRVLEQRGSIRNNRGHFPAVIEDADRIRAIAVRRGDSQAEAKALLLKTWPLLYLKRRDDMERHMATLLTLGEREGIDQARTGAALARGITRESWDGALVEVEAIFRQCEEEARQIGDVDTQMAALSSFADARMWQGHTREALERYRHFVDWALAAGNGGMVIGSRFFMSMQYGNLGEFSNAMVSLEDGRHVAEASGEQFWLVRFPNTLAWIHHEAFDFANALEISQQGLELVRPTGLLEPEANTVINIGLAAMEVGDMGGAREWFNEAADIFERDDWFRWRYRQRLELAASEYHLRLGDFYQAVAHAESCRSQAEATSAGKYLILAHRQLARIYLALGQLERVRLCLDSAQRELEKTDLVLAAWRLHETWSQYWRETGQPEQARRHAAESLDVLERLASNAPANLSSTILASPAVAELRAAIY